MKNWIRSEFSCRALSEYISLKTIARIFIKICIKEAHPETVTLVKRSSTVDRLTIPLWGIGRLLFDMIFHK